MKTLFLTLGVYFGITLHSVRADQPVSPALKSAAKDALTVSEAMDKVNQLINKFNQRWPGRDLTPAEASQARQEKAEVEQTRAQVSTTYEKSWTRFENELDQSGLSHPEGTLRDLARICATGRVPDSWVGGGGSGGSSRERRGLSSLSVEVLRRGTDAGRPGYALYTVQIRASLDGPARQSSRVDLTSRGSDDLAAAIRGNSSIAFKSGQSSVSGKFTISARPGQRVEIEGRHNDLDRFSTESTSFYAE